MFKAITENKYQFVKLFMDHGMNLMDFANQDILAELYKEEYVSKIYNWHSTFLATYLWI